MISVVITHHLDENQYLLDWCLESVLKQDIEKEIIVVSDSKNPPTVHASVNRIWNTNGSLAFPAKKFNAALKLINPNSTHVFYLNDDIILGKDVLSSTLKASKDDAIITPLINADDLNIFSRSESDPLRLKDNNLTAQIAEDPEFRFRVMNYKPGDSFVMATNRLYMSACMFPKAILDKMGPIDEVYEFGWDDEDRKSVV